MLQHTREVCSLQSSPAHLLVPSSALQGSSPPQSSPGETTRAPFHAAHGQIIRVLFVQKLRAIAMYFMDHMIFLAILELLLLRISIELPKTLNIQHNMLMNSNHPNWLHPHSTATSYGHSYPKQSQTYSLCYIFRTMFFGTAFSISTIYVLPYCLLFNVNSKIGF